MVFLCGHRREMANRITTEVMFAAVVRAMLPEVVTTPKRGGHSMAPGVEGIFLG